MKVKGPNVIYICAYCGERAETELEGEICPDTPPIELEAWFRAKREAEFKFLDGTPIKEGDIISAICPKCNKLGLPHKILEEVS